jgi:UDP-N-acetylmuramoylalanine--D-glutamate ligase
MPLSEVALRDRRPDWVALEVSSFQLHDTPSINPVVGVVTNLSADHLDRYASVDEYYADKAMLFRNAHDRSKWVLNRDRRGRDAPRGATPLDATAWRAARDGPTRWLRRLGHEGGARSPPPRRYL